MTILANVVFWFVQKSRVLARLISGLILFRKNSYLKSSGWTESFHSRLPIDRRGNPLPWYTYAAIDFLEGRISSGLSVYEYGSGNSTLWWASRVSRVVSCEDNKDWYDHIAPLVPENVEYTHHAYKPGGEYCRSIKSFDEKFDIIVIDGRDRMNCLEHSLDSLVKTGVIIWDNSERHTGEFGLLLKKGFKQLPFTGLGPINTYSWETSVFYRDQNCLGL